MPFLLQFPKEVHCFPSWSLLREAVSRDQPTGLSICCIGGKCWRFLSGQVAVHIQLSLRTCWNQLQVNYQLIFSDAQISSNSMVLVFFFPGMNHHQQNRLKLKIHASLFVKEMRDVPALPELQKLRLHVPGSSLASLATSSGLQLSTCFGPKVPKSHLKPYHAGSACFPSAATCICGGGQVGIYTLGLGVGVWDLTYPSL